MLSVFITGTDTNIGKTFITAGLAATLQSLNYTTSVYKPIQTGAAVKGGFAQSPDLVFIKTMDPYIKTYSTYLLKEHALPVIASEQEGVVIDKNVIKSDYEEISKDFDACIVEGTGGIMTPVAPDLYISDIAKTLNLPVVIVVRPDSSTVNHTLLTVNNALSKGLNIRGVIINDFPENVKSLDVKTAPRLIEEYSDVKILGIMKHFHDFKKINPSDLITNVLNGIDIESVFDVKIAKLDIQ